MTNICIIVKPGVNPTKDAITSSEIFPPNYNVYRNDRGILGGGVFILVEKSITSVVYSWFDTF
jgi:hypothetical protein